MSMLAICVVSSDKQLGRRCWKRSEESASAFVTRITRRKSDPSQKRILLVEDDRKVGAFLEEGLCQEGFLVDWAHDGDEAVELAKAGVYDLILLDYMLPKKDGVQVAADIRRRGQQ